MLAGPDDEEEWLAWLKEQSDKRRENAGDEWDKERQFDPFDPRIAQLLMAYEARQNYELEVLLRIKDRLAFVEARTVLRKVLLFT